MEFDETRRGDYQSPIASAYRRCGFGCGMGGMGGSAWSNGITVYTARSTAKLMLLSLMIKTRPRVRHDDGGRVGAQVRRGRTLAERLGITREPHDDHLEKTSSGPNCT